MKFGASHWMSATAYVISIILGNVFVVAFGIGTLALYQAGHPENTFFSLTFPLGAMWIGLTFSMRDFVQRFWGHKASWFWMLVATGITYIFNRDVALASVLSFAASESIDWTMFYLLRNKTMRIRLVASNLLSCPVDSIIFVTIAFGVPWYSPAVWGQAIVKYMCGLLALPLIPVIENFCGFFRRKILPSEAGEDMLFSSLDEISPSTKI